MGKIDAYREQLGPLLTRGDRAQLASLLVASSNLPGPRGNLELAAALGDCFAASASLVDAWWETLLHWASIPASDAPTGDPAEFLPFCALQALGASYFGVDDARRREIVGCLKCGARDVRWRIREGIALGFQRIAEVDFSAVETIFSDWLTSASPAERRAIVAALAHPPILEGPDGEAVARYCLQVVETLLEGVRAASAEARRSEEFRVLRQGLEYAVSLFVARLPEPGFALLTRWAREPDPDVKRIVRSNLGKARLAKRYPAEVRAALATL